MLNCDNCYEVIVPECQDTFTLIAGLDPNTLYKWVITDYHGNEIEGEAVSDYEGQLEIEHGIPQRFTCGNYAELEIFLPGYVDEAVNLSFCEENWKCVILHFICEEGAVIIQEQDCDQPPPVLPCNLCNNISEATAQEVVDCFSEEKKTAVKEIICDDIPVCEDGHVCNTSGDVCVDVGSGGTNTFPDTPVKKSDGVLIANAPSGKDYNVADSVVSNSDNSYNQNVKATDPLALADVNHTDSDGSPVILPGMTPMICTPCVQPELITTNRAGHYDFSGLVINTSNSFGIVGAGGGISQVNDLSGNAKHFTQATGANQPALTVGANALAGALFSGAQWMNNADKAYWNFLHNPINYTMYFIIRIGNVASPGVQYGIIGNDGGASANIGLNIRYNDVSPQVNQFIYVITRGGAGTFHLSLAVSHVLIANQFDIMSIYYTQNKMGSGEMDGRGGVGYSNTVNVNNSTLDLQLGAIGGNALPINNSIIQEWIIYNVAHTRTQRIQMHRYLMNKYAL